ncbi:MAG: hypothetical protein HYZ22_02585 [Chloroflexi bacterium]|nr:hypothetical protein [Chloroflexota bacterium]
MTTPQNVDVNVQGNFSGNLVVGDHNIVVNNPNGGVVNIVPPRPPAEPRTRPVNLRPRNFPELLDRVSEMEALTHAIQSSMPVTVFGESGIGKTSLLRKAAHAVDAKKYPDGVIYMVVRGDARDDLLQNIYDSFFVSPIDQKPDDDEVRSRLNKVRALIILDDLTLSREDAAFVLDAMPQSIFILASTERALWGEGQAISLDGLPEDMAVQLFQQELRRALTEDEKPVAAQICRVLLAHPLRILQTASMIREDGLSVSQAFQKLTTTRTQSPTVEMAIQKSNDTQKKIFSLLAVAGGFALTREHMLKMIPVPNFEVEMKSLVARGFISEQGPNLSLSSDAASAIGKLWNLTDWEDALVNHFTNWLQTGPQDMLVDQASDLLYHLLQRVGEKKQWPQVVKLGKALERISILQKKWQRWMKILDLLRMAARALMDKNLEGWVLHQMGTRSMCLGMKGEAQGFLKQALDMRNTIGDKAGSQVTQHNLNVLMNIPIPVQNAKPVRPRNGNAARWLTMAAVGGGAGIVFLIFLFLGYRYFVPAETPVPPSPTDTFTPIPLTDTDVPTHTLTPTKTRTPTSTSTPTPVVLFDFVREANNSDNVFWYVVTDYGTFDELTTPLQFNEDPTIYNPLEYMKLFETSYVGWLITPPVEDRSRENLVLIAYPHRENSRVTGTFGLPFPLHKDDVFVARVGHINTNKEIPFDSDGLVYRVYYYESEIEKAVLLGEMQDFMDGKTYDWEIPIPDHLDGVIIRFILEVDSGKSASFDYAAWLDASLVGMPR